MAELLAGLQAARKRLLLARGGGIADHSSWNEATRLLEVLEYSNGYLQGETLETANEFLRFQGAPATEPAASPATTRKW